MASKEIKTISSPILSSLEMAWRLEYSNSEKWKLCEPIHVKWSWRRFDFVYAFKVKEIKAN